MDFPVFPHFVALQSRSKLLRQMPELAVGWAEARQSPRSTTAVVSYFEILINTETIQLFKVLLLWDENWIDSEML